MEKFPQPDNQPPFDRIAIEMTDEETTAVVDAVENRAVEQSEDHLPAVQPSYDVEDFLGQFWD
jgi:hypothetical protein